MWHKNQRILQVGSKSDEVGFEAYNRCAKMGAIIVTGHEHSYCRSKPISSYVSVLDHITNHLPAIQVPRTTTYIPRRFLRWFSCHKAWPLVAHCRWNWWNGNCSCSCPQTIRTNWHNLQFLACPTLSLWVRAKPVVGCLCLLPWFRWCRCAREEICFILFIFNLVFNSRAGVQVQLKRKPETSILLL